MFLAGLRWIWTLAAAAAALSQAGLPDGPVPPGAQGSGPAVEEVRPDTLPVPVLLVPGWGDHAPGLEPFVRRLVEAGWSESRISTVTFRDRFGSNRQNAKEIATAVQILKGLTGSERVDVVAHSMGGLAVRQYLLEEGGGEHVRRVVFLGTPHRGTVAAMLSWGDGGREMVPGSAFLSQLNEAPVVPPGVEALAIRTPADLRIIPASSARLEGEGVVNVELCCPTHTGLVDDERTFLEVVRFLTEHDTPARAATGG